MYLQAASFGSFGETMRSGLTIISVVFLSSCALESTRGGVVASPDIVRVYAAQCSTPIGSLTSVGYVAAGIEVVDRECAVFFDSLILLGKDARFLSSGASTAGTQTTLLLTALAKSASTIAAVAAAAEIAKALIDEFAKEYAFSPYAAELRSLTMSAMIKFRESNEFAGAITELSQYGNTADSLCFAQNIVRNYASICSISGIESLARQAIASGKIVDGKSDGRKAAISQFSGNIPGYRVFQLPDLSVE